MAFRNNRIEIEQIAKSYAELLKKEMNVDSVYLFGSYVKGNYTEDSDIDIAVITKDFTTDLVDETLKMMKIRRKIDNRIEPHPFRVNDPFINELLNTGVKIM